MLAIASLIGDTKSVTAEIPTEAASANFIHLHFAVPRKFLDPHRMLSSVFKLTLDIDPRVLCVQKALRSYRANVEIMIKGFSRVRFPIMAQTSQAAWKVHSSCA